MPIPSITEQRYQEGRAEGLEKGLEKGLEQGREQGLEAGLVTAAASLLRVRFGDDERIDPIAGRLAGLGAAGCMARIEGARTLDELA